MANTLLYCDVFGRNKTSSFKLNGRLISVQNRA